MNTLQRNQAFRNLPRKRRNWITAIDPETGRWRRFRNIARAVEWISVLTVQAGGCPVAYATLAPQICTARKRGAVSYGYRWR